MLPLSPHGRCPYEQRPLGWEAHVTGVPGCSALTACAALVPTLPTLLQAAKCWSDLTFYHDVRTDRERQLVNQKAIEYALKVGETGGGAGGACEREGETVGLLGAERGGWRPSLRASSLCRKGSGGGPASKGAAWRGPLAAATAAGTAPPTAGEACLCAPPSPSSRLRPPLPPAGH